MYKMKKIYKLYIGILLSIVTVSCVDTLDADKYFRDRKTMEDIFADKDSTEAWLSTCLLLSRRRKYGSIDQRKYFVVFCR
ncbi:hypothetical protein, partial [Bacteroides ovatus]|uniref:hypothetical protein n=1 Tax=Bacteroides ovatus TaxID=28116 RepID=UPI002165BEB6